MALVLQRVPHILLASAFALSGLAAAPALSDPDPAPPPAGPTPQPVPYPGDGQPPPTCTNRFCIPQPGTTQGGTAAHKHIGQPKYSDFAKSSAASNATMQSDSLELNVETVAWGQPGQPPVLNSADPMEGGQATAARTYRPGRPTYGNVTQVASDPEEGGQVAASKAAKPNVSEINVTKVKDVSSSNMMSADTSEPGKVEVPNIVAEPVAKGTASFKTLAGLCATGKHLTKVKIVTRSGSYTLHDAIVTSVTPAGDGMEEVSLAYDSVGD